MDAAIELGLVLAAQFLAGVGGARLATHVYRRQLARFPERRRYILPRLAIALENRGMFLEALELYEELSANAPDFYAMTMAGMMLERLGRPMEALRHYEHVASHATSVAEREYAATASRRLRHAAENEMQPPWESEDGGAPR